MRKFSTFLKELRSSAWISQLQLANILDVSPLLITLIETGKKDPSKKFINNLAQKLEVKSASILPLLSDETIDIDSLTGIEKKLIWLVDKLQLILIKKNAHRLLKYV